MKTIVLLVTLASAITSHSFLDCKAAEPAKADPALAKKLTETILPRCSFEGCNLDEIGGYFAQRAKELSVDKQPLKIRFESEDVAKKQPASLSLTDVPLGVALAYAVEMAGAGMVLDGDTIRITGTPIPGSMTSADFANKEAATLPDLSKIVIPSLKLDADGDFAFHLFAVKMESEKASQAKKPVNIVSMVDAKVGKKTNGMEFKNKTAREVLEELAETTGTRVVFAAHAVEFRPAAQLP